MTKYFCIILLLLYADLFFFYWFFSAACVACGNFVLCFPEESRYAHRKDILTTIKTLCQNYLSYNICFVWSAWKSCHCIDISKYTHTVVYWYICMMRKGVWFPSNKTSKLQIVIFHTTCKYLLYCFLQELHASPVSSFLQQPTG